MRYLGDGRPVYTATDLCDYLACGHLVTLKRRVARGEVIAADRSALSEVLATLGAGHEQSHLETLRAKGLSVRAFEDDRDRSASSVEELRALETETVEAMAEGFDVIYQPTFFDGRWMGRADFLLRVETPSARKLANSLMLARIAPCSVCQVMTTPMNAPTTTANPIITLIPPSLSIDFCVASDRSSRDHALY